VISAVATKRRPDPETRARVEPPAGGVGWSARVPWLLLAVVLIAGGGLTAAVLVSNLAARTPALAVAEDLSRGQVLTRADVRVVSVAVDAQVPTMAPGDIDAVVGRTVAASLPAGSLLSPQVLSRSDLVGDDADVVGLLLEAGQYPVADLAPGDRVAVIATGDTTRRASARVAEAEVHAVGDLEVSSTQRLVSIVVPTEAVDAVAQAAAADGVRLVLTGAGQ
jgi:hypothetical protein